MTTEIVRPGIVVGTDGSPAAKVAVRWAARDAAMRNVPLTVVHVASGLLAQWSQMPVPKGLGEWQQRQGRQFLDDAIGIVAEEAIAGARPSQVKTEIYYSATIPTLVDISKDADMIVVGTRGIGALGGLLGSVSTGLAHYAHCPVAVIREQEPRMSQLAQAPVLVGIDGSPVSEVATAVAFDEASRRRVDLIALHAWSDTGMADFPGIDWSAMESSEDALLAERLAGWQERYPDVRIQRLVVCDRPARQIIEHAQSVQLVVVGSHGRGGFAGMLLGSVSTAVIQSVHTPVIVARQS